MRQVLIVALVAACMRLWFLDSPAGTTPTWSAPDEPGAIVASDAHAVSFSDTTPERDAPRRLYERVMQEMRGGDCEAVVQGFRLFIEMHGGSSLAPHADYWRGDCEFRLGRYAESIASFDRLIERASANPKLAAAALMKKGLSYKKLGEPGRSRHALELVVVQFPETQAADLARQALITPADRF
jgi:TolA-binding protein